MNKYLLLWGESSDCIYQQEFNSREEAFNWLNRLEVKWNQSEEGHWYKFYKESSMITDCEWEITKNLVNKPLNIV